jgi:hypothetical protein
MKKVNTRAAKQTKNFSEQKLTIGLDLGDRSSWYCVRFECDTTAQHSAEHLAHGFPSGARSLFNNHTARLPQHALAVGEP